MWSSFAALSQKEKEPMDMCLERGTVRSEVFFFRFIFVRFGWIVSGKSNLGLHNRVGDEACGNEFATEPTPVQATKCIR